MNNTDAFCAVKPEHGGLVHLCRGDSMTTLCGRFTGSWFDVDAMALVTCKRCDAKFLAQFPVSPTKE